MNCIEFVCTTNFGRSPIAELVARNELRKRVSNAYRVISSGTEVEHITAGTVPREHQQAIVQRAMERGDVYSLNDSAIAWALEKGEPQTLYSLYREAAHRFHIEQTAFPI